MATMKDVARRAGVSIATVSAVVSGGAYVSPPLKARVQAAIAELGYARNAMARSLKQGNSSLIGLVVPDITNPLFTTLVDRIQKLAAAEDYSVLLGLTDHNTGALEPDVLGLMRPHQVAGTIMCPTGAASAYATISETVGNMKLVLVDNASEALDVDSVVVDNAMASALAARHILSHGHKCIAVIAGSSHQYVAQERLKSFKRVLAEKSVTLDDALVADGDFREEEAYAAARRILTGPTRPTAIFIAGNLMIIGVMRAIAELGLRVPDDISVVGIDDFSWAAAFQPALTVVRQPIVDMATTAFDRLLARIRGDDGPLHRDVLVPELVVRQSCGMVPEHRGLEERTLTAVTD